MDILALRDQVVDDYRAYFESFINIADRRLDAVIRDELSRGTLWPDAVLQLNPAYVQRRSLRELARDGVILEDTARFFGPDLRLHQHQEEALLIAQRGEPYVVTTGTGSGKSLTYLLPIVDGIFRRLEAGDAATGVQALIVYPMNALINSQETSLREYAERNWPDCPLRFRKYTGEVKRDARNEIVQNPPHVLLTNYVMLEYLLLRAAERPLLRQATRDLRFLVVDELHFYRGRQGADVAMLLRRVRERAGRTDLVVAGTSATIAAGEGLDHATQRRQIAGVASTLFGVPVSAENVVEETLRRVTSVPVPGTPEELDEALASIPDATPLAVASHPLAAWVESYFGITAEDGRLIRQKPRTFQSGLELLTQVTELDEVFCRQALQAALDAGNRAITPTGDPVFPFRLHQFYASGGSVYTTIEPPDTRRITTTGQYVTADGAQLYPVAFCRDCGQEYYLCARSSEDDARLVPRTPSVDDPVDPALGTAGYFALDPEATLWPGEDAIPEWWYTRARTPSIRSDLRRFVPVEQWVTPTGEIHQIPQLDTVRGWFTEHPLRICLRCRATYDLRSREFAKLATLSQTGRSTATTVVAGGAVVALRQDASVDADAHKVLSFTDTRQDAPLQAGHLNDFVAVALLRGALARALERHGSLRLGDVGRAAFDAMELAPGDFMSAPLSSGPGYDRARSVMMDLLEYRAIEDLRWSGRVTFPNLERTGLLRVRYAGLDQLVDNARWSDVPLMETASPERRLQVLEDVLDYLRAELAIEAESLKPDAARSLIPRTRSNLREPWAIQERSLRRQRLALLPGAEDPSVGDDSPISLGYRSRIGAYLRRADTWREETAPEPHPLGTAAGEELARQIVERLAGHVLSEVRTHGQLVGVRVNADVLIWERGAGVPPPPNRVRLRDAMRRNLQELRREPNPYFHRLYAERSRQLVGVTGQPHTGAVPHELRQQREDDFKNGRLAALFCSPTMELGVDIRDLVVVHMRNVPRSPANYAQRSGRAGRGGRPALVLTFCAEGNAHDQYFFRRKERMISGSVTPPRIDLANEDLVEAHLHSVWLAATGVGLETSIGDVLDLDDPDQPVLLDIRNQFEQAGRRSFEVIERFRRVCGGEGDLAAAPWLTDERLREVVAEAPARFDHAFDRWRTLYRDAIRLRDEARRVMDRHRVSPAEREIATQREREARRELDLLLNQTSRQTDTQTETDFYPYRYLGSEGFLPGYNFPRLPVRAIVQAGDGVHNIDRPRFLGLSEFGPGNYIYHEGRKHRVDRCVLPTGGPGDRLTRATICSACGAIHPAEWHDRDDCAYCGGRMDGAGSLRLQNLLDQPVVRTQRVSPITSEEEVRARHGYHITTHFRVPPAVQPRRAAVADPATGDSLLELTYIPRGELWCINHGWRRTARRNGFALNPSTGEWVRTPEEDLDPGAEVEDSSLGAPGASAQTPITGVRPYVSDYRNVLLVRIVEVPGTSNQDAERFLQSFAAALDRAIQIVYQVEEGELEVELIGEGAQRRILLWENAEGGTGVWERMFEDAAAFDALAREALRLCHAQLDGTPLPEWTDRCAAACYDCLLSYGNQPAHRLLDRHLVIPFLVRLSTASIRHVTGERSREAHYHWLRDLVDSTFERDVLDHLYVHGHRLPDRAQHRPDDSVHVQPDFYYERDGRRGVCVFVDGPSHDAARAADRDSAVRQALEDAGYGVVSLRHDAPLGDQVAAYPTLFGLAQPRPTPGTTTSAPQPDFPSVVAADDLDLFPLAWRPLVTLWRSEHKLVVEPGSDVASTGRVIGSTLALVRGLSGTLHVIDQGDAQAEALAVELRGQGQATVTLAANDLATHLLLAALGLEGN